MRFLPRPDCTVRVLHSDALSASRKLSFADKPARSARVYVRKIVLAKEIRHSVERGSGQVKISFASFVSASRQLLSSLQQRPAARCYNPAVRTIQMRRVLLTIVRVVALVYLGLCGVLLLFQRAFIYFPQPPSGDCQGTMINLPVQTARVFVCTRPR